jgi:hypothetical protein
MNDTKKRAAAISAVMAYIRKEEEDRQTQLPSPIEVSRIENLWGVSGRQAQMQLRNLMQLRTFHGLKFR